MTRLRKKIERRIREREKEKLEMNMNQILARVGKDHKWSGNILQRIAEEMVRYAIRIEEVVKNDLSEKLLKEIERQIINKETVSIQINAKTRLGKSTLGILLGMYILNIMIKHGMREQGTKFGMVNIARDQGERVKKMRNPNLMYDVIVTDEDNELEETGENATVEKAQRNVFSDVQAARYIHGVWICPYGTMDRNIDIKLEIRNKNKGLLHTRVYYNMRTSHYSGWVLIGTADFNVKPLIVNWERVEERFYNYLRTGNEKDKKYVEKWARKDFYVEYMMKKHEKMELMNREGIMHTRDLDYAEIRKAVVMSLKPLAELEFISLQRIKNNVISKIESEFRKRKMPSSIVGKAAEYERVVGILELYRTKVEIKRNIKTFQIKADKQKMSKDVFNKTMGILSKAKQEIDEEIENTENTLNRLIAINRKYNEQLER